MDFMSLVLQEQINQRLTIESANPIAFMNKDDIPFGEFYTSSSTKIIRTTDYAPNNILWDSTKENNKNFFTLNTTTGYITIPESGLYEFEVRVRILTVTNANTKFKLHLHNNGTYLKTLDVVTVTSTSQEGMVTGTTKLKLTAGALIGVRFAANGPATASFDPTETCITVTKLAD